MRLLSAPAGKSAQQLEVAATERRVVELDEVIRLKRKEINDLEQTLVNQLSELGLKNYEEERAWKAKIDALTIEVEALESRRKSALVPLQEREEAVQTREGALLKREETVAIKETDVEHTKELLEDKLDKLSERETDATAYSLRLNSREFAIALQEKQTMQRMEALTEILRESFEDMEKARYEAAEYKARLKGRDVSISEREKFVETQLDSFANREARIADRYKTLQRAIAETKIKHGVSDPKLIGP